MEKWKNQSPNPTVEIDEKGMAKALQKASKAEEQHEFDKKVIAWFHLIRLVTDVDTDKNRHKGKFKKTRLFEVMSLNIYAKMVESIPSSWDTDEVPTKWMRDLYKEFIEWQNNGGLQKAIWHPSDKQMKFERWKDRKRCE